MVCLKQKPLEERAKDFARLLIEGKKLNIDPFRNYAQLSEIMSYFEENKYVELMFPTNKYMARYEFTEKGKEWALPQ